MLLEQQQKLISLISEALQHMLPETTFNVTLERPKVAAHGDIASNIAMQLARVAKQNPRALAEQITNLLEKNPETSSLIQKMEVAGPGFINFYLTSEAKREVLNEISKYGNIFGHKPQGEHKVMVEFVSANPTGPLHVGHARQAALGDSLCRIFATQGFEVVSEFYYNDAGNQIDNLAASVQARARNIDPDHPEFPVDGYRGEYIKDIAADFLKKKTIQASDSDPVTASGNIEDIENIRQFSVAYLRKEQDLDLKAFGLTFDNYYLESSLYTTGRVDETVQALINSGHTYEHEGALWLRTTDLGTGDDKDRVMRKTDGGYTYFVPDVAYHVTKWERGFHQAINIQGSDHHGTIARVKAGLQALNIGIPTSYPQYIIHKMVKVMREGKEVKISKRAGSYVSLRDLIDWVGRDAVRFFLAQRRADSEFVFDIDLALSQTEENPVYYIQYAHARICSVLNQCEDLSNEIQQASTTPLVANTEFDLLRRLSEYPSVLEQAANELAPHQLAFWLRDCASDFHSWYNTERFLVSDKNLQLARLRLAQATKQVLANGLSLLGVSAPDKM